MGKFRLGMRVRVIDAYADEEILIGAEGVINELDCVSQCDQVGMLGVTIGDEDDWCFHACQLEPIQPSGHQVISWADMEGLWQPSGVEA